MKPKQLTHWRRLGVTVLLLLAAGWAVSRELPPGGDLAISSITAQGTNILLIANVPPGFSQVALETRSTLNSPWSDAGIMDVSANGGSITYTLTKPGAMAFFRLRGMSGTNSATTGNVTSSELNYVVIAPLGPEVAVVNSDGRTTNADEAVFHFKGNIDGSDKIVITREGALWEHVNWGWPEDGVTVNGTEWNPREKNYMTTTGKAKFLPEHFSLETASLEEINGRGLVALERGANAMIVYLDDIQSGSGEYEFKLHFHPAGSKLARKASSTVILKIAAQVDGYDIFKITASEATWTHAGWAMPEGVKLNGVAWPVAETNVLKNEGTNTYLPASVDFSTARIVSRKGRDVATMWADNDSVWVRFADNPNGSDYYELEIAFGQEGLRAEANAAAR